MKEYMKRNAVLLVLLAAAVAVSAAVIAGRWRVEAGNKQYDILIDYNEVELMAEQSGRDVSWWLEQFRDMGLTRVALTEETLASLMENSPLPVTATVMDAVLQDADWAESYPAAFVSAIEAYGYDRFDVLVEVFGREAAGFVVDAVERRFHSEDLVVLDQGEEAYILINSTVDDALYERDEGYYTTAGKSFSSRSVLSASKLMYVSLGLMPEKVERIQSLGLEVAPRTICYNSFNDARYTQAVIEGYERSPTPLAARRKKAAARQANTTAPAKLASSLKELGITSHAAPTHSQAAPASSRVHLRFMGRKVSGSSAPPTPAPSPTASRTREGTW